MAARVYRFCPQCDHIDSHNPIHCATSINQNLTGLTTSPDVAQVVVIFFSFLSKYQFRYALLVSRWKDGAREEEEHSSILILSTYQSG